MKKLLIAITLLLALPSMALAEEPDPQEKNVAEQQYSVNGKVYLLNCWNGDWNQWKEKLRNKDNGQEKAEESEEQKNTEQGNEKEVTDKPNEEVTEAPKEADENDGTEVTEQEEQKEDTITSVSEFEKEVVRLTNEEREKHGLAPLELDEELSNVARDKSKDMRDAGYFSHNSPNHGSPFDMMQAYGIDYRTAGENIAAGQRSPEEVVNGWMNSEGHRANILNGSYTHIGVGHVEGGSYGHYWTQMFISK